MPDAKGEKPILFSSGMVRAILDGRKTQTRRVIDLSDKNVLSLDQRKVGWTCNPALARVGDVGKMISALAGKPRDIVSQQIIVPSRHPEEKMPWADCGAERVYCPLGSVGDRLWVRENWWSDNRDAGVVIYDATPEFGKYRNTGKVVRSTCPDGTQPTREESRAAMLPKFWRKRPSIHMPRWASRLTLELTAVRVERLQEIAHRDALAEGVAYDVSKSDGAPVPRFRDLWDQLNAKRGYSWASNPWVWVLSFKRITGERSTTASASL